jgi:tetratricopeptide (TPR) repeat protein
MIPSVLRSLRLPSLRRAGAPPEPPREPPPGAPESELAGRLCTARALARSLLDTDPCERLGIPFGMHADPCAALARYRRQMGAARACGDTSGEAAALGRTAAAYLELGDVPATIAAFEDAMACVRYTDDLEPLVAALYAGLGLACERLGDVERALTCFSLDLAAADATGRERPAIVALGHMGRLHRARGQHADAVSALVRGLELALRQGEPALESELWWELGLTFAARGDARGAVRAMRRRVQYAEATAHPLVEVLRQQCAALAPEPNEIDGAGVAPGDSTAAGRAERPRNAAGTAGTREAAGRPAA